MFSKLRQDLWYAVRLLAKRPGFTAAAAMSLALGIGANTAIFSMFDAIVLRPLSFPDPSRLVVPWMVPENLPDNQNAWTVPEYMQLKDHTGPFESFGVMFGAVHDFGAEADAAPAERIVGQQFSHGMFPTLGVKPLMGRVFTEDEDPIETPAPVLLLSYNLWQRRFAGDPNIINKVVRLDGQPRTIIGVMPSEFHIFDDNAQYWEPMQIFRVQLQGTARAFIVVGRLKPGETMVQAQSAMDAFATQLGSTFPADKGWKIQIQSMHEALYGWMKSPLLLLQGIVGFVLLIACANVAGLLMARSSSRQIEVAVRTALGANRSRIVSQLLTESVLLSMIGGAIGVFVAWLGLLLLVATSPNWVPRLQNIGLHPPVLVFTALLSVVTGLIFGVVPALRGSTPNLVGTLKESGRGTGDNLSQDRLRGALVALQIAMSLVLLIGAGLLIMTFVRIQHADVGCDTNGVLVFDYRFPNTQMIKRVGSHNGFPLLEISPEPPLTFAHILEQLQRTPGVQSAAGISQRPLGGGAMSLSFTIAGQPKPAVAPGAQDQFSAATYIVTPNYFATMRIPVRGRDFTAQDTTSGQWVAIVNQSMARQFWPHDDPIGKQLTIDLVPDEQPRTIVGVVGDVPLARWQTPSPVMFVPSLQQPAHWRGPFGNARIDMAFVARASSDPTQLIPPVRQFLSRLNPDKPPTDIQTLEQFLGGQLDGQRQYTFLLGLFGFIATVLAATGIYGVMAYSVAQRTREIGIRMALGANGGDVRRLMLRRAGVLIAIGIVAGLAGSWALTRLISSQLFGVSATDPATFAAAAALLAVIALAASFIPTQRATAVDPTIALRAE